MENMQENITKYFICVGGVLLNQLSCELLKGGFEKFNREVELDKSDEVDRDVKDKISNKKWNVRTGNGFGPGFGNIGKGGENMRSDVVQFQK